jgi:hypothetical protein
MAKRIRFGECSCPCCKAFCPYQAVLEMIDQLKKKGVHADNAASLAVGFVKDIERPNHSAASH